MGWIAGVGLMAVGSKASLGVGSSSGWFGTLAMWKWWRPRGLDREGDCCGLTTELSQLSEE